LTAGGAHAGATGCSMLRTTLASCLAATSLFASGLAPAAQPETIVVQHIHADEEAAVRKFMRENPGTQVEFRQVSFQSLLESLPVQLASGEGPDISMVADWGGLTRYYLDIRPYIGQKEADYFERQFHNILVPMRGGDPKSKAIYGMGGAVTLNGAFVNVTLFKQAHVPLPPPGATWDDWAAAARQVAKATRTEMPMEMDRSAHRFASLALSYGAKLVDEHGDFVVDAGLKAAVEKFVSWHRDGTMPMDLWGAVGGTTHLDRFSDFMNGKVVFYFGGSWSLFLMDKTVGDAFDWKVVDAPCGPVACVLMPGGAAMVAFKHTRHPELCARFLAFLAREDNMREALARHANIPAATSLVKSGVDYPNDSERVRVGLADFTRQMPNVPPQAYAFQGWRYQRAALNALTTRISQILTHELDVDTALAFVKRDVDLAIEASK
jgi:alpha-1,4-digalacturonate transport system substrate-binding protein